MGFYADRSARWALPLTVLCLVGVSVAWAVVREQNPPRLRVCIDDPAPCEGEEVVQPLLTVTSVSDDGYVAGRTYYEVPVQGDPAGLEVGQEVTVSGHWRQGRVVEQWRTVHTRRGGKYALGLVGLLVCAGLVVVGFRVRRTEAGWRVIERG